MVWFIFQEIVDYERKECVLRYEYGNASLITATHSNSMEVFYSVIIINQRDTRDIEYLMKVNLE